MRKCDIIIPIYNAYECVVECVASVLENTDLEENRLILINDKSTDKRIYTLLDEYRKKYKNFIILENEENKGFVGTVNVGMKYSSENDVLLLNSDTIVTPKWLDSIKKCAYSGEMIATVTPLSNNATMASVPVAFIKNELPEGMSINEMAEIVDKCSYLDYPDLPTGHGFCLYIKRNVLDEVGFFDEETFGKGYGEENDFCFRCLDCGYRHLLCDNVYIYHKESQSFSDSKIALMKSGGEKLEKRYPEYTKKLNEWCRRFPLKYIGSNVSFAMNNSDSKPNILVIIHDFYDVENHLGGTTLHVYDIITRLRDKYNFHVLAPVDEIYHLTSYWTNSTSELVFPHFTDSRKYQFYNNNYKKIVEDIIDNFAIDAIHIHHMKNHYFDLVDIIRKYKLKTFLSIHDFYSVCPLINKMYCNKTYCGKPSVEDCGECLKKTLNMTQNMITYWREGWIKLFKESSLIIAPSDSCMEEVQITYPNIKVDVIEHGVDLEKSNEKLSIKDEQTYEVAFLGAIGVIKGSEILNEMLKKKLDNINLHLFGTYDRILDKKLKRKIIDHGKYKREELSSLLKENNIKLICLLSTCPETYSYTLTEAVAAGIPVLVSNMGALKSRVIKDNLGWVIDVNKDNPADDVINKINDIFKDPEGYQEKVNSISKYKIRSVDEMIKDYENIYKTINKQKKNINKDAIKDKIWYNNRYFSVVSYADYSWVFDTLKWRIISKIKIPQKLKDVFRRDKDD